ncbi:hypothetical protein M7I_5730 [Glarea lozoyensis 74030]|uniref:Uncharacterized protein n=1 Tax=Glarea lozoyensis (strain ATCC 74030 / MF5533) TaxID=1104152 RepID=H0ESN8_GLAL7|nr:hypothetical protein M7I_5730 [Glarea lozoyensis 74030]
MAYGDSSHRSARLLVALYEAVNTLKFEHGYISQHECVALHPWACDLLAAFHAHELDTSIVGSLSKLQLHVARGMRLCLLLRHKTTVRLVGSIKCWAPRETVPQEHETCAYTVAR